ncbi:MAG: ABC transporter ATP-binding protein [Polyangiaceae bacterium]|jgi:ABC-2 type transport system ATP-binding protein|nr:ABC transporter ATP-binding protein [Polyangiaceae bacterium]
MDGPSSVVAPALRCTQLQKQYGAVRAVDGIDLDVARGCCFGLLGPNGAGKTTTVEILIGLVPHDGGQAHVLGQRWRHGHDSALRARIGVQLQETRLSEKLTVRETVQLFRSFYANGVALDDLIAAVELVDKADVRVGKLSGGQKQRLALAVALVGDPEVLFLDEPTTGLDPQARRMIWELLDGMRRRGRTILLTTHYMEEAARLCDRVAVMDRGRIIACGTPDELIRSLDADQVVEMQTRGEVDADMLQRLQGVRGVRCRDQLVRLRLTRFGDTLPRLLAELDRQQIRILAMSTHEPTLEDVFMSLTGRGLRDD